MATALSGRTVEFHGGIANRVGALRAERITMKKSGAVAQMDRATVS
jgi:hypothetical protein